MSYPTGSDTLKTFTGTLDLQDGNGPRYGKYEERVDAYGSSYWHYVGDTRAPSSGGTTVHVAPADTTGAWSVVFDANGNGFRVNKITGDVVPMDIDKTPGASSGPSRNPYAGESALNYTGNPDYSSRVVYIGGRWTVDGKPTTMEGALLPDSGGGSDAYDISYGGKFYKMGPDGKPQLVIDLSTPPSGGGSPSGSSGNSLAIAAMNNAADMAEIGARAAADQANIAARAEADAKELALRYGFESEQAREARAAAAAEAALDRKLRVSLAKVDFEQWRTGMSLQAMERQLAAAKTLAEVIGQVDPNAYRAFLEAGGMNIANAIAGGGNAVSEAAMLPAARALQTAETPIKIPTFDEAFPDSASWMAGQASAVPVPGGNASPTGGTDGATTPPAVPPPPPATQATAPNRIEEGEAGGRLNIPWSPLVQPGGDGSIGYDPRQAAGAQLTQLWGAPNYASNEAAIAADPIIQQSLAAQPPKTLLPGQSIPIDNGVGGGPIDLMRQGTVPMLASGGMTRAPMMLVGERGPELVANPTRQPLGVIPHQQTDRMMDQGLRVPGYEDGTAENEMIWDNGWVKAPTTRPPPSPVATQPATTVTAVPPVQQQTQAVPPPAPSPVAAPVAASPTQPAATAPSAPVVPQPTFANTSPVPLPPATGGLTAPDPRLAPPPVWSPDTTPKPGDPGYDEWAARRPTPRPVEGLDPSTGYPYGYTPTPKPPGTVGYTGTPYGTPASTVTPGTFVSPFDGKTYIDGTKTFASSAVPPPGITTAAVPAPSPLTASQPAGIPAGTVLPGNAITGEDRSYLDRIREIRETSPISRDWNPYDVGYQWMDPTWRSVNEQAFQTKFGVPVQSLLAEASRFGIPSMNRRGVVMSR